MLLFLSLSAADQTVWLLPRFSSGAVSRTHDVRTCVGGKAVNAARAAHMAGGECVVVGFFSPGLAAELSREGIAVDGVETAAPIRRATSVVDLAAGEVSELVEEAFPPAPPELAEVAERVLRRARDAAVLCLCGSLPAGVPASFYGDLMGRVGGLRVIVDAQGATLGSTLAGRPFLVKPNRAEVSAFLDCPAQTLLDVGAQARELRSRGAQYVAVGCGAEGLVLAGDGEPTLFIPPRVKAVNATGCGDAVTGVTAYGLARGAGLEESVRFAVACGAASALDPVPGAFSPATAREFEARVRVVPLTPQIGA
jgi:tagatose 6-phosphate kinase